MSPYHGRCCVCGQRFPRRWRALAWLLALTGPIGCRPCVNRRRANQQRGPTMSAPAHCEACGRPFYATTRHVARLPEHAGALEVCGHCWRQITAPAGTAPEEHPTIVETHRVRNMDRRDMRR